MKIIELHPVSKNKRGIFHKNGIRLEPHEERTAKFLTLYGFNVEIIRPNNSPKMRNPDVLMSGTLWEMKAPIKYNENTLKKKIKKASEQAQKIVYDLRNVKRGHKKLQSSVIKLFTGNADIRRMILITKDGKVLDFYKR